MIDNTPIVLIVGGPKTGKTNFYKKYTFVSPNPITIKCTPNVTLHTNPGMVFVDTPGVQEWRSKFEYSWQGVFKFADVILDFGNWSESEIYGNKGNLNPKILKWEENDEFTLKRLTDYLQERK